MSDHIEPLVMNKKFKITLIRVFSVQISMKIFFYVCIINNEYVIEWFRNRNQRLVRKIVSTKKVGQYMFNF